LPDWAPMQIDPSALGTAARKVLSTDAPAPLRMMGAKGVLPGAPPADVLTVIIALSVTDGGSVQATAAQTLSKLPRPILDGALNGRLQPPVVQVLAELFGQDLEVLPRILAQPAIGEDTLCELCTKANEAAGELIGTNEALILSHPAVIEKLYMNKRVRMSTADRLIDLAVRNGLELDFPAFKEAAAAIREQLVPEASEERNYSDQLFLDLDKTANEIVLADDEAICILDEEGNESVVEKAVPLFAWLQKATVTEKIRMAMLGNSTARLLLVRDSNRLVAEAAVKSPRMTENDATQIAAMRSVSDEVLRLIANSRDLVRGYQVKLNLVTNPRTPFTFASRLLPHLRHNDIRAIARSKNVPGAVNKAARQMLMRRES